MCGEVDANILSAVLSFPSSDGCLNWATSPETRSDITVWLTLSHKDIASSWHCRLEEIKESLGRVPWNPAGLDLMVVLTVNTAGHCREGGRASGANQTFPKSPSAPPAPAQLSPQSLSFETAFKARGPAPGGKSRQVSYCECSHLSQLTL